MNLAAAIFGLAAASLALVPAAAHAHNSEFILAKVIPAPGGELTVELSVDYGANPLIQSEAEAREELSRVLLVRDLHSVRPLTELGELRFEKRNSFDPACPLPPEPSGEAMSHEVLTALWHGKLQGHSVCFEVPKDDHSTVVLWNAQDEKSRWLFLLGGDQSPAIAFPKERVPPGLAGVLTVSVAGALLWPFRRRFGPLRCLSKVPASDLSSPP